MNTILRFVVLVSFLLLLGLTTSSPALADDPVTAAHPFVEDPIEMLNRLGVQVVFLPILSNRSGLSSDESGQSTDQPLVSASVPLCQCVEYARYFFDPDLPVLTGDYPNANSLVEPGRNGGLWMTRQGFAPTSTPHLNGLVVLHHGPASNGYNGVDANVNLLVVTSGHIGVIAGALRTENNGATWVIPMKSANYGGTQSDLGCTNVNQVDVRVPANSPAVTFWHQGDANRDNKIDMIDYEIWRKEYLGYLTTKTADFNRDNRVDIIDYNIWRLGFM